MENNALVERLALELSEDYLEKTGERAKWHFCLYFAQLQVAKNHTKLCTRCRPGDGEKCKSFVKMTRRALEYKIGIVTEEDKERLVERVMENARRAQDQGEDQAEGTDESGDHPGVQLRDSGGDAGSGADAERSGDPEVTEG